MMNIINSKNAIFFKEFLIQEDIIFLHIIHKVKVLLSTHFSFKIANFIEIGRLKKIDDW